MKNSDREHWEGYVDHEETAFKMSVVGCLEKVREVIRETLKSFEFEQEIVEIVMWKAWNKRDQFEAEDLMIYILTCALHEIIERQPEAAEPVRKFLLS